MGKLVSTKSTKKVTKSKVLKKKTSSKVRNRQFLKNHLIYSIVYDIWISGVKLGINRKKSITSISIKETVEGSDSATIKVSDPDFLFINDNLYIEDRKIKIKLGWSFSTYRVLFNGYISAIDIEFPSSGVPELIITCVDNTHRMNKTKRNKTYKNKTSEQIVKSICKKYGFKCVTQSGYKYTKEDSITQHNETDIGFITKLAGDEVYPFTARLVGDTFYYIKAGNLSKTSSMELNYRKYPNEIISFSPKIDVEVKEKTSGSTNKSKKIKSVSTGKVTKDTSTDSGKSDSSTKDTGSMKSSSKGKTYNPVTKKWS